MAAKAEDDMANDLDHYRFIKLYKCADCKYTSDNRRKFTKFRGEYFCMNCAIGDNAIGKRAKISLDNPHTTRKESV